jgi:hypothetical protein
MNKTLAILVIALAALCPAAPSYAQDAAPTPTPPGDTHTYTDPGMSFTAPPDAVLVGRNDVPVNRLGGELEPIAAWVLHPGKEDARMIQLQMEAFDGPPDQWEGQFESQTHSGSNGTLIRNKTPMSLSNGMPAYFVEVAYGEGFDAKKEFAIVWADGMRGIVLSETTRLGDASPEEAKEVLKQATATRYPLYQP